MKKTLKSGWARWSWRWGCAASGQAFGGETTEPVFRPPLIKQVSAQQTVQPAVPTPAESPAAEPQQVPTSRWDAQEPIQTPEQATWSRDGGCDGMLSATCYGPGCQFIVGIEATFFWPQFSRDVSEHRLQQRAWVDVNDRQQRRARIGRRQPAGWSAHHAGRARRMLGPGRPLLEFCANSGNNFTPALPDADSKRHPAVRHVQRLHGRPRSAAPLLLAELGYVRLRRRALRLGEQRSQSVDPEHASDDDLVQSPGVRRPAVQRCRRDVRRVRPATAVLRRRCLEGLLHEPLLDLCGATASPTCRPTLRR